MSTGAGDAPRQSAWARFRARRGFGWALALVILIPIIFLLWIALLDWFRDDDVADAPPGALSLAEITGEPDAYQGQIVTTGGEISTVLTPRAVVIGEDTLLGDSELLVASLDPIAIVDDAGVEGEPLSEGDLIQVTGEVALMPATSIAGDELDDAYDFLLTDPAFDDFEGEPVLLLDSVQPDS